MSNRPNIFDIATSELTQDAFIVWLLKWADQKLAGEDNQLHACAVSFVRSLLSLSSDYKITSIEAGRQWKNIDVWALVNNEYFIVIEDKKGSKEHSNQLLRYAESAKKHYENSDIKIALIYFKMEEQGEYYAVEEAGYSAFTRKMMLSVLEKYSEAESVNPNEIIMDFSRYLTGIDEQIHSYKNLPIKQWHWYSWTGFFAETQGEIGGNWDYVPNAAGGFLGYWWYWHTLNIKDTNCEMYLQLEYGRLVFKLCVDNVDERKNIRSVYREVIYRLAPEHGVDVQQFGRIGRAMGAAKLADDYRIADEQGIISMPATIAALKKAENLLNAVVSELKSANPLAVVS